MSAGNDLPGWHVRHSRGVPGRKSSENR